MGKPAGNYPPSVLDEINFDPTQQSFFERPRRIIAHQS
jgi:hypothetical protein